MKYLLHVQIGRRHFRGANPLYSSYTDTLQENPGYRWLPYCFGAGDSSPVLEMLKRCTQRVGKHTSAYGVSGAMHGSDAPLTLCGLAARTHGEPVGHEVEVGWLKNSRSTAITNAGHALAAANVNLFIIMSKIKEFAFGEKTWGRDQRRLCLLVRGEWRVP